MTLSEKILACKAGKDPVKPGEFLLLKVDVALANDITAPVAINEFLKAGGKKVYNPQAVVFVADHFTPNKDILSAEQVKLMRQFAIEQRIEKFFDVGRMGIEHVMLPEEGLVKSGDLVVGADSHTCTYGALGAFATGVGSTDLAGVFMMGKVWLMAPETIQVKLIGQFKPYVSGKDVILKLIAMLGVNGANYKALEFCENGVQQISMDSRFTICNMAIECGAKSGLFPIDDLTVAYEQARGITVEKMAADPNAGYAQTVEINLDKLQSQVAYPHLPSNCKDVDEAEKDNIAIDQVVIGSCTNGRIEDLRVAANILRGKKVAQHVRCIVIPGSQKVYRQAMQEGLFEVFLSADCAISTPTCGPCLGGHMGVLAAGEKAVATTNRNFVGRMGHQQSEVYLASPAVAAATAITGCITSAEHV